MSLKSTLEKIDADLEKGLKLKATNRLRNLIQEYPNQLELWSKLAETYYESGFLDAAGKYWILTEPKEARVKKCVDLYEKSVNYSGSQILHEIVFRGDKTKLPVYAQNKLTALEIDSQKKTNNIPYFKPKSNKKKKNKVEETFKDKFVHFVFFAVFILILLFIIVGFTTVIQWLF